MTEQLVERGPHTGQPGGQAVDAHAIGTQRWNGHVYLVIVPGGQLREEGEPAHADGRLRRQVVRGLDPAGDLPAGHDGTHPVGHHEQTGENDEDDQELAHRYGSLTGSARGKPVNPYGCGLN